MQRVSVTALVDYADCPQLWSYRHVDDLRLPTVPPNMASGIVVHALLPGVLRGEVIDKAVVMGRLEETGVSEPGRYVGGVLNALSQVPKWMFGTMWHSEEELEMEVGGVTLVGRPDLWTRDEGGVRLIEVKTTSNDPLDYLLWNPQHRYYLLLLRHLFPDEALWFNYMCLPTSGRAPDMGLDQAFGKGAEERARQELQNTLTSMESVVRPRYSWRCTRCDFAPLCTLVIQGKDWREEAAARYARVARAAR